MDFEVGEDDLITIDILAIGAACGAMMAIISLVVFITKPLKAFLKAQEIQSEAIRNILRQLIINMTDEILDKDEITREQVYCLRKLNDNYKALEGNSTVDERVKLALRTNKIKGRFVPTAEGGDEK